MNTSARPKVPQETDHIQERSSNPGVDTMLQELCSTEQAPPGKPPGPNVPDEGAFETFVGGSGI